jgi:hypothetical protein
MAITQFGAQVATVGSFLRSTWFTARDDQLGMMDVAWRISASTLAGVFLGDVADAIVTNTAVDLSVILGLNTAELGVKVSQLGTTSPGLPGIASSVLTGAAGTGILPAQVSGLITLNTLLAGRKGRGRVYVPFIGNAYQDTDDTPTAALVTDMATFMTDWLSLSLVNGTGGGTINVFPIIWHRATNTHTDIDAFRANKLFATQRRRGNYGRLNPPIIR